MIESVDSNTNHLRRKLCTCALIHGPSCDGHQKRAKHIPRFYRLFMVNTACLYPGESKTVTDRFFMLYCYYVALFNTDLEAGSLGGFFVVRKNFAAVLPDIQIKVVLNCIYTIFAVSSTVL